MLHLEELLQIETEATTLSILQKYPGIWKLHEACALKSRFTHYGPELFFNSPSDAIIKGKVDFGNNIGYQLIKGNDTTHGTQGSWRFFFAITDEKYFLALARKVSAGEIPEEVLLLMDRACEKFVEDPKWGLSL